MKHAKAPYRSLIDAENVPGLHGTEVLWKLSSFVGTIRIYGCLQSFKGWQPFIDGYNLEVIRHKGGKQASDTLMRKDAWNYVEHQSITHLVFVTNDGDFVPDIRKLCARGCQVTVIGEQRASARLKVVCTHFILLDWK
jgi:uncharacterized LabA/DUF88 family protein